MNDDHPVCRHHSTIRFHSYLVFPLFFQLSSGLVEFDRIQFLFQNGQLAIFLFDFLSQHLFAIQHLIGQKKISMRYAPYQTLPSILHDSFQAIDSIKKMAYKSTTRLEIGGRYLEDALYVSTVGCRTRVVDHAMQISLDRLVL